LVEDIENAPLGLEDDPEPTYRGFRLQALYTLDKILAADDSWSFRPEGVEDLAVYGEDGQINEVVQVKSLASPLAPSSLGAAFYRRSATLVSDKPDVPITLASYGPVGQRLTAALDEGDERARDQVAEYIAGVIGSGEIATRIVERLRIEAVAEHDVVQRVTERLGSLCTGVDSKAALEILWWWVYSASEHRTLLDRRLIVKKITSVGKFLRHRSAFHDEWFKTIVPVEDLHVPPDRRKALVEEFASGVSARPEHIAAHVDVRRDALLDRIHSSLAKSSVVVVHGASGQGKTALSYRYCYDFFPARWRYRVDLVETDSHARNIALALTGHARAAAVNMLVVVDVRPGDTAWVELARSLASHQSIKVLVTVREEDWRRVFGQLADLPHSDIELTLAEGEAEAVYEHLRATHDIPHVLNFGDAWRAFGGRGPLLEFVHFLRHTDTLEARLSSQIARLQDAVRAGDTQPQERDFLRLAAVATACEARVDLANLAAATGVLAPQRTVEAFEKEYFLRLTPDGRHVVALHPIRSTILARLLTDPALSPWPEAAGRVLPLIREQDLERFLLSAFLYQRSSRATVLDSVNSFHPETWTGLRGCMRAVLWLGVREYIDQNDAVIRDAFERCDEGWRYMLNFDVAGIADFDPTEMLAGLGETGERAAEAARGFAARQTDPQGIFAHCESFMRSRTKPALPPASNRDWRSLGEVCFWLGHLRIESSVTDWVSEDVLAAVLECEDIQSIGEACAGVFVLSEKRYQEWYEANRERVLGRLRSALRATSFVEEETAVTAVFLLTREELALASQLDDSSGGANLTLNDLVVSKLRTISQVLPQKERYGCKGVGHLIRSIASPYDETVKEGILKRYLLPRWGPELNHLFCQLAEFGFRLGTWADFANEVLRIRRGVLHLSAELKVGILAHYGSRDTINIMKDYLEPTRWDRLKAGCFRVAFMPQCAVDEWGLDPSSDESLSLSRPGKQVEARRTRALGYVKAAREYERTLRNFLMQAPPVIVWNVTMGKVKGKRKRKQTEGQLKKAGISVRNRRLTMVNLADLCKSLDAFQLELGRLLAERVEIEEHTALSSREMHELPSLCLLWNEFLERPGFTRESTARGARLQLLRDLDPERTLAGLRAELDRALTRMSKDGIDFRVVDTDARWESKPTMWIVCDASDPCRLLDASRIVERCLRSSLAACRDDDAQRFVAELYWQHVVAVPLVAGKSLRKTAYPNLWGAIHTQTTGENKDWRHIPLPVPDETWRSTGLEHWQLPGLREFQGLVEAVVQLWEMCGHLADLGRVEEDLDDLGASIAQEYIREKEDTLSLLAQEAIDKHAALVTSYGALSETELRGRPMLVECFLVVEPLGAELLLLPREECGDCERLTLKDLADWHGRLSEAVMLAGLAELLWSADALGLTCDLERLERTIGETEAGGTAPSRGARRKKRR